MKRRDILKAALGFTLLALTNASGALTRGPKRIGYLSGASQGLREYTIDILEERLRALGWRAGETIEFDLRWADGDFSRLNIFAAHLWDAIALLKRAAPNALKAAKPGTPEFRIALRDELERGKDVYLNNGLSTMSPTDHNGYDERSAFLIKVDGGRFRLMESPR